MRSPGPGARHLANQHVLAGVPLGQAVLWWALVNDLLPADYDFEMTLAIAAGNRLEDHCGSAKAAGAKLLETVNALLNRYALGSDWRNVEKTSSGHAKYLSAASIQHASMKMTQRYYLGKPEADA